MSWIIGAISKENIEAMLPQDKTIAFSFPIKNGYNLSISAGGSKSTLFFSPPEENFKWLSAGTGILEDSDSFKFMEAKEWEKFFNCSRNPGKLNGHFVFLYRNAEQLKLLTDITGLRDIYLLKDNERIIFSTRIDLISKFIRPEIDFSQLGGRWILINQISTKSIFKKLIRLTAGSCGTINLNTFEITIESVAQIPDITINNNAENEIKELISSLISFPLKENKKISLSLSGGMDSRIILAHLLKSDKNKWNAHTFGNPGQPDSIIAKEIAEESAFNLELVHTPVLNTDFIKDLSAYCSSVYLTAPASSFLQMREYRFINHLNDVIIDGGFGEILRREFLNKLLWKCKNAVMSKNSKDIIRHLRLFRADIFNEEINRQMEKGALEQLDALIHSLPSAAETGIENWLDLFSIKTRLPNFYGPEQSRVDSEYVSYMPFAQPALLNKIFSLSIKERRSGKFSKNLINGLIPSLTKYPLAKGNASHPFCMNSIQSRLWVRFRKSFSKKLYNDTSQTDMLIHLKEFILDTINSAKVKENSAYDYKKIQIIASEFYSGKAEYANRLDWWLAFELFMQSMKK